MPKKNDKLKKKAPIKAKPMAKVEVKAKPAAKSQPKTVKPVKSTKSVPIAKVKSGPIEKAKASVRQALEKVTKVAKGALHSEAPAKAKGGKVTKAPITPKAPAKDLKGKAAAPKPTKSDLKKAAPKASAKPVEDKALKSKASPAGKLPRTDAKADVKTEKKGKAPEQKQATGKRAAAQLARNLNRCREPGCDSEALLSGYCRLHYIKNWRRIKKKEAIVMTGQLDGYVEELVAKYPDKYLDAIENDLASEKEWTKVITDLEFGATEDDFVADEEDAGLPEATSRRTGFDDEGEDVF